MEIFMNFSAYKSSVLLVEVMSIRLNSLNMKLFLISVTIYITLNITHANEFAKVFGKCKEQEKVSESDIGKISKGEEPETKEGKCMLACVGEAFGTVRKNIINFLKKY